MDGSLSPSNEDGMGSFQSLDTLVLDGSNVNEGVEQSALAAVATRVLVSRGWKNSDAERAVQGLTVKELWPIVRG